MSSLYDWNMPERKDGQGRLFDQFGDPSVGSLGQMLTALTESNGGVLPALLAQLPVDQSGIAAERQILDAYELTGRMPRLATPGYLEGSFTSEGPTVRARDLAGAAAVWVVTTGTIVQQLF